MAPLARDCFAASGEMMRIEEALERISAVVRPVAETQPVPLAQALGRVLAGDLLADRDVPPHDNAAVDGFALRHRDLAANRTTELPVAGRVAAGAASPLPVPPGHAARIFTGAPVPAGLDTVVMQEHVGEARGEPGWRVTVPAGTAPGANIRRAGEDLAVGATALAAGRRLRPADLGLAASLGRDVLTVRRPISAALFSTGDELVEPGQATRVGAIYDSNRFSIGGLLRDIGIAVTDLGIFPDDRRRITAALAEAARGHDVVVTSGGVSVGEEDHVRAAVEASGGRLHAWHLAIKPGHPVALGQIGLTPFIGFPGNPVAVMVTFLRLARPILLGLMGAAEEEPPGFPVVAGFAHAKKAGRREYLRVRLRRTPGTGTPVAECYPLQGSGVLSSMAWADGLVELDEETTAVAEGTTVRYLPFPLLR